MSERISEIEARLAAARPGPWLVNDEEQTVRVESAEGGEWGGEIMYDRSAEHPTYWVSEFRPDAEFIANSPADVAHLLTELRKRDEALDALIYVADNKAADNMIGRWWAGVIKGTIHSHLNPATKLGPTP